MNHSSGDMKREEKGEDENRSVADKSEDETRDMNGHLRTRCLKHLCHVVVIMLLFRFRQKKIDFVLIFLIKVNTGSENMEPVSPAASYTSRGLK